MKLMKNRNFLTILSAVIAVIIAFVIIPGIISGIKDTIYVVRVTENVEPYTLITEDMLMLKEVGSYNMPQDIIVKKEEILGKYSNVTILPGDNLYSEKFILKSEIKNGALYDTDESNMAVTVTLKTNAAGLAGMLIPGDIVDLVVYMENKEIGEYRVMEVPELLNLEILDVYRNNQTGSDEIKNVTFNVDSDQAVKLVEAENKGIIHLIFVSRGYIE